MNITFMSFSVDIILAVNNSKDVELISLGEVEKMQAIADYQKFLYLAKNTKTHSIVPTKRIDAVWHLHMLHPVAYHKDCINFFGYILDHRPSDGTESNKKQLNENFLKTSELWENQFGVKYIAAKAICDNSSSGSDCSDGLCAMGGPDGKIYSPIPFRKCNELVSAAECQGDAPGCSSGGSCSTASCNSSN